MLKNEFNQKRFLSIMLDNYSYLFSKEGLKRIYKDLNKNKSFTNFANVTINYKECIKDSEDDCICIKENYPKMCEWLENGETRIIYTIPPVQLRKLEKNEASYFCTELAGGKVPAIDIITQNNYYISILELNKKDKLFLVSIFSGNNIKKISMNEKSAKKIVTSNIDGTIFNKRLIVKKDKLFNLNKLLFTTFDDIIEVDLLEWQSNEINRFLSRF